MNTLATLYRLRGQLGFAAGDTAEDGRLLATLVAATTLIERGAGRRFTPRLATLLHTVRPDTPQELLLTDDLLALTTLLNGDGRTIAPADVLILPGSRLRLKGGAAFTWQDTPHQAISVSGLWGWHDDWARAWRGSSDSVQNNPLSAGATVLNVLDADGPDSFAEAPRFQVGQLLRLEAEYVRVLAVNPAANTLSILRGVNGTTAAAHAVHTPLDIYQPPHDAELLCLRLAMWLFREPNTVNGDSLPPLLRPALETLRRVRV